MVNLIRFGVSMEKDVFTEFDKFIKGRNYKNRSQAIVDIIRQEFVKKEWEEGKEVAGAIVILYNHDKRNLVDRLTDIQHDYHNVIVSMQHIHLDEKNCLEIIAVKGKTGIAKMLYQKLKSIKGVKHGTIAMTSTGRKI